MKLGKNPFPTISNINFLPWLEGGERTERCFEKNCISITRPQQYNVVFLLMNGIIWGGK